MDGRRKQGAQHAKDVAVAAHRGVDQEILDVEEAATLLGVSASDDLHSGQKGDIPATRVGRDGAFARQNLIAWVAQW